MNDIEDGIIHLTDLATWIGLEKTSIFYITLFIVGQILSEILVPEVRK